MGGGAEDEFGAGEGAVGDAQLARLAEEIGGEDGAGGKSGAEEVEGEVELGVLEGLGFVGGNFGGGVGDGVGMPAEDGGG